MAARSRAELPRRWRAKASTMLRSRLQLLGAHGLIWAPQFPQACGRSRSCGASRGHGTGTRGLPAQHGRRHQPQGGAGPHELLLLLFSLPPPPPPPCRGGWPPGTHCGAQGSYDRAPRGAMSWMRPLQSILGYGKWP